MAKTNVPQTLPSNHQESSVGVERHGAFWGDATDPPAASAQGDALQAFRATLKEIAEQTWQSLPDSAGRINEALEIILARDIIPCKPHTDTRGLLVCRFTVGAASDTSSHIVTHDDEQGWVCDCPDVETEAPKGRCKHILSAMMWLRTHALVQARRGQASGYGTVPEGGQVDLPPPLSGTSVSVSVHVEVDGRRVQITLHDHDESRILDRLGEWLARFPGEAGPDVSPDRQHDRDWCAIHGARMKPRSNERGVSYAHWLADEDRWCNGKAGNHMTH